VGFDERRRAALDQDFDISQQGGPNYVCGTADFMVKVAKWRLVGCTHLFSDQDLEHVNMFSATTTTSFFHEKFIKFQTRHFPHEFISVLCVFGQLVFCSDDDVRCIEACMLCRPKYTLTWQEMNLLVDWFCFFLLDR
jgi:hypothetical protein